ncbi:uncharacterized protein BDZ99DRAFT_518705 [Mytilinidion resinicola]|uniref:F-box domain-containing protein n=1 Tax=Mytilinidion resinicola TaxID=574789 RepID=A0A6A6YSE6_9PEZI|nr:uncharacterized protein BDZ99DRAFT_518705 [Mytilinidion resinicola]KAF2811429.1 hypothetical protein BDZ99DRAFT_518705 [Mytilinidion resinicola]
MAQALPRRRGPPRTLPNEILLEIFSFVGRNQPRLATLRSIALASRTFKDLVTPILYSTFSALEYAPDRDNLTAPMCFFLRTLIESPRLVKHVKDFKWEICNQLDAEKALSAAEFEQVFQKARDLNLHLNTPFWNILMDMKDATRDMDPLVAILLHLLPNLEKLSLTMVTIEDGFPEYLYPRPGGVLTIDTLTKVRALRLDAEDNMGDFVDLMPWLQLPSQTALSLGAIALDINVPTLGPLNLTSINIEGGFVEQPCLEGLLKSCQKLKSFSYEIDALGRPEENAATPEEMLITVREHASDTLVELKLRLIDPDPDSDAHWDWDDITEWDFAFRGLKNLKVLEIDAPFILGTDEYIRTDIHLTEVLPPSITELRLHVCGQRVLEEIGDLARVTRLVYPALDHVDIDSFKTFFWTPAYLKDVQKRFRTADVAFDYSFDYDYYFSPSYEGDLCRAYDFAREWASPALSGLMEVLISEKESE